MKISILELKQMKKKKPAFKTITDCLFLDHEMHMLESFNTCDF